MLTFDWRWWEAVILSDFSVTLFLHREQIWSRWWQLIDIKAEHKKHRRREKGHHLLHRLHRVYGLRVDERRRRYSLQTLKESCWEESCKCCCSCCFAGSPTSKSKLFSYYLKYRSSLYHFLLFLNWLKTVNSVLKLIFKDSSVWVKKYSVQYSVLIFNPSFISFFNLLAQFVQHRPEFNSYIDILMFLSNILSNTKGARTCGEEIQTQLFSFCKRNIFFMQPVRGVFKIQEIPSMLSNNLLAFSEQLFSREQKCFKVYISKTFAYNTLTSIKCTIYMI